MRKINIIIISSVVFLLLCSCEDYLNVKHKGKLSEKELLNDEKGFENAMYGCYATLASPALYGENLSYGFMDELAQLYRTNASTDVLNEILVYDYANPRVTSTKDKIWEQIYTIILNVNNIMENLKTKDLSSNNLYAIIQGECYGLRGLLHFEILRIYAENVQLNPQGRGIPYAYQSDLKNKKVSKLRESYDNVIKDLTEAEKLLERHELNMKNTARLNYMKNRMTQMNIYAVYTLKAKVYFTMGMYKEAIEYAEKVLNSNVFSLSLPKEIKTVQKFPAGSEMIFGLYNNKLYAKIYTSFLKEKSIFPRIVRSDAKQIYEVASFTPQSTDYRFLSFFKDGATLQFSRFLEAEATGKGDNTPEKLVQGVNVFRLPEVYYILSESHLMLGTFDKAVEYLNIVRKSRGLGDLALPMTGKQTWLLEELAKERIKEFWGEGEIFLDHKRRNKGFKDVNGIKIEPSKKMFVLPWPNKELEYGSK